MIEKFCTRCRESLNYPSTEFKCFSVTSISIDAERFPEELKVKIQDRFGVTKIDICYSCAIEALGLTRIDR